MERFYSENRCVCAHSNVQPARPWPEQLCWCAWAPFRFVITASKDIKKDQELVHVYKSKGWRTCFQVKPRSTQSVANRDLELGMRLQVLAEKDQ
jgi:hypothetical protein